jgi:phage shock protein E
MKHILETASIIDVRSRGEFAQGHYEGAINIPLDEVPQKIEELKQMKQPIVMYCRSGNRSGMAVAMLKQMGVADVHNGGALNQLLQKVS